MVITQRFRNLPLFAKFLLPFLGLVVVLGSLGTFFVVRDLSERAESELDESLTRLSLDTRSVLRDRELYLLESANFAANLAGLAEAVSRRDTAESTRLLRSVPALKTELDLLVVARPDGASLLSFLPTQSGAEPATLDRATKWTDHAFVRDALAHERGEKFAGLVRGGGRTMLAVAGGICRDPGCAATGVAIVGMDVSRLASTFGRPAADAQTGVALYDARGALVGSSGATIGPQTPRLPASGLLRRTLDADGVRIAAAYAKWEVRAERIGTVAVAVPAAPAFASVRGAALRLALLVLAGMIGIVALGALVSRFTLAQVRELLATNRSLGAGDLSARAPVLGRDELGELATGVNQMAEQLEASRETLELRVQQRTEEVERLLKERSEIFASLSHELRTPLAVILREAELQKDARYRTSRAIDQTSGVISDSARQLLALVNDILEFARADAERIDVTIEPVSASQVVGDLRPTLEGLARASHLSLTIDVPASLPLMLADRKRLRDVVLNLVDNAVKYTPPGGHVSVSAEAAADAVRFAVADSGVGIPEGVGDRVFEPFFRVGSQTQAGQASSGLGLALSKRLVQAQGGSISFESTLDRGSTFVVTMPVSGTGGGRRRRAGRALSGGRSS